MNGDVDIPDPPTEEKADRARSRRRWLTLAEIVAVTGVGIAGLNLYSNWAERRDSAAERSVEQSSAAQEKARVELVGTVKHDGKELLLNDAHHDLSEATIAFPQALGIAIQHPAGEPAIEARWFDQPLLKLTDSGADDKTGRLPVLVTVRYFVGDDARTTSAIYDVVWRTKGHLFGGRSLGIEGMKLRRRGGSQAALDAAWARLKPEAR
ncbi:hypothetical protein [Sphingomonas oligophenolica]|uniref:Uncharacterized protein n=1 Tax=Sphingomonas oligophenolica TaxID=301154 RepID=A0A502CNS2_9SPHN|nr:hypothetical protein [Sphingomonas oligophenolica]TPG14402.1 hypothetical protein EAH84_03580 [Sphingomonas oligophenolica]